MAFTYVVRKKPNPNAELAILIAKLADDERVEITGTSRAEMQQLQINLLKRMPGKITTRMNGNNTLYVWRT